MAGTLLDAQFGFKKETTFGTGVTVDRFLEVLADGTSHKPDPMPIQGEGLRVSSRYDRSARLVAGRGKGEVTVKAELFSKGFGTLWELCVGTSASANVSGATYQQWHRALVTGTVLPSATVQLGTPLSTSSGSVTAHTYAGCLVKSWTLEFPTDGIPTLSVDFWAASYTNATSLASASYTSTPTLFTTKAATTKIGGTYTVPTSTALTTTSSMTTVTNVRSWSISADNGLNERPRLGGWQVPTLGKPSITVTWQIDSDATTYEDAFTGQTALPFFAQVTGGALSTGNETFEVLVPDCRITDHDMTQMTNGDGHVASITAKATDNLTDTPLYIVQRTADTAL